MKKKTAPIILLLISLTFLSCSALPEKYTSGVSKGQCLPAFPDKDGWYGGDGAYSIKLDDQRTLWLFGDTFVSCEGFRKDRTNMDVILGTTMGISSCSKNNEFKIQYYLSHRKGKFVSSFGEDEWLWPQDPFIIQGVLYIPLISIAPGDREDELFNFEVAGHKFARVKDFSAVDPRDWSYDYIDLTPAIPREIAAFAATSVVYRDYVYFYPFFVYSKDNINTFGNILARIHVGRIDQPVGAVEYLNRDGTWRDHLEPRTVKIVLDAFASELSVRYHPDDNKWVAVYLSINNKGDQLFYQTADRLEGPWSAPRPLGSNIPEVDFQSPLYDKGNFCYAGKEHIEFSRGKNLVVTYVCNSSEDMQSQTSFLRRNMFLYRPVVRETGY
jgi:hypothetical protein